MLPILTSFFTKLFRLGSETGPIFTSGSGSPEGAVTAPVGSFYARTDGGAGTTHYRKEVGSGNTGWTPTTTGGGGGSFSVTGIEVDFGYPVALQKSFTITDAACTTTSNIIAHQSGKAATGRSSDENEMDKFIFVCTPGTGQFTLSMYCLTGLAGGKYKINYVIG